MKSSGFLILFTLVILQGWSQQNTTGPRFSIQAILLDQATEEPIAFASVYNVNTNKGTVSSENGRFQLLNNNLGDTLVISFIGYQTKRIEIREVPFLEKIYLTPISHQLVELVIHSDDAYLYRALEGCRKNRYTSEHTASTYFNVQSFADGQQIELVESYHNGKYKDYSVEELMLKQGRIALKSFNEHSFLSTEVSKAISMHNLFDANGLFPHSPLEYRGAQLRKKFLLKNAGFYYTEDSVPILIISFRPRINDGNFFYGEIFLDETNHRIYKIELKIEDARKWPFVAIGHADSLQNIDFQITKRYQLIENAMTIESIDFNYSLDYLTKAKEKIQISTQALLVAFDYKNHYLLPFFKYPKGAYEDYLRINATPYNEAFWRESKSFEMNEIQKQNEEFISDEAVVTNQKRFSELDHFKKGFFERPFIFWSDSTAIKMREIKEDSALYEKFQLRPPAERYHLEVQLYMDINVIDGELNIQTATIFDPFQSYYYFPITEEANEFFNLYFDLAERFREKLVEINLLTNDVATVQQNYIQIKMEFESCSRIFFREVARGTNADQMEQWKHRINTNDF